MKSIGWNNRTSGTSGTAQGTTSWEVVDLPLVPGTNAVVFTAVDSAANTAESSLFVEYWPPAIAVSPLSLNASASEGNSPTATTVEVWNSGYGTLDFNIADDVDWLTISPAAGSSSGAAQQFSVRFDASRLAAGSYSGRITIANASNPSQSVVVPVLLTILGTVSTPVFTPPGNSSFRSRVNVTISTSTDSATIHYTLDDTAPNETSPIFLGTPITITNTAMLRARAWKVGMLPSAETAARFEIVLPGIFPNIAYYTF